MEKTEHRVVIVTGSGRGIGKAVATEFAKNGDITIIAEIDPELGKATEKSILTDGGQAVFIQTDVRKPEEIIHLMEEAVRQFGRIDVLVNNAGVSRFKSPYELTVEEWDDVININLRGYFLCAREAAKFMRKNDKGGAIVNIASTRAYMSEQNSEAYAATKGGIVALTHALSISFSDDLITVNSISPGWIETGDYSALKPEHHAEHPSRRVGRPEDIARAAIFLTEPNNDFITGENLMVDGGMTKKMIYGE